MYRSIICLLSTWEYKYHSDIFYGTLPEETNSGYDHWYTIVESSEDSKGEQIHTAQSADSLSSTACNSDLLDDSMSAAIACGVMAIANAYYAMCGDNLATVAFSEEDMRKLLSKCFEKKRSSKFYLPVNLCKNQDMHTTSI